MDAKTEARTASFMVFSAITHTALAIALITMSVELKKSESVEIEIMSTMGEQPVTPIVQEKVEEEIQAPQIAEEEAPETVVEKTTPAPAVVAAPVAKAAPAAAAPTPKALPAARKAPVQASASETPVQQDSPVVLPVVQNTELAQVSEEPETELKDEDVTSDFEKIDQEHQAKVAAANQEMKEQADKESKAQEAQLLALKKKNEEESARIAQANAEKRAQERASLAAAAAAAEAAKQAQLAEEAKAAQAKKQGELASNQSQNFGGGTGEVRSIEDLKPMPGNEKPVYDSDDRLKGRKGEVSFVAYVSREGFLSNFKMLKSSGHRELDAKTLKAIKGWKFYPGQEGMVEIPFSWDLKGGVRPVGPILRTKRSASTSSNYETSR